MKKFYLIATILSLAFFASCTDDDYAPSVVPSSDVITVLGRITPFKDYDVKSRGPKDEDESKLTSMAMALFPVVSDGKGGLTTGPCAYFQYSQSQAELLFTIDRSSGGYTKNAPYAMYVFANMDMSGLGVGSDLEDMMEKFHEVENIAIPTNGFPMIGSLGDTFSTDFDKDGKVFILAPTADGTDDTDLVAPKVDGTTQTLLTVPMKALYAKINFTIELDSDQGIEGNYSPQFTIEGYTVKNVPAKVDFSNETNSDTEVLTGDGFTVPKTGVASGSNKITFSFYLPERLLTPTTIWENYEYPFGKGNAIRNEDLVHRQRFKSKLLGDSQQATHVVISGQYRDHQNHFWNVDYTIHLGADNFGDFNILRNSEYNNIITIKGIQISNDMSDNDQKISIDHRVNVERSQPVIISVRRETLLDSHFEVRPFRVRKNDFIDVDGIDAVKLEVVNPTTTNWIRLERSFGDGTPENSPQTRVNGEVKSIYIDEDPTRASYGKRRFFTYNLIDGVNADATDATLQNSTVVYLPIHDDGECCWIYVDECTETGDDVRSGKIKITYGTLNGSTFTPANNVDYPAVEYVISQRKLFVVQGIKEYHIEYFEEYLYNFDAEDRYAETHYEGMKWGLEGIQLSYDHEALYFKSKTGEWANDIVDRFTGEAPAFYDYYVKSHDEERMADPKQVTLHEYAGFDFCTEIIQLVNGGQNGKDGQPIDTDLNNDIDVLQLDQEPRSAIEYCYNKNKRNNKGQVAWTGNSDNLKWYLPAIDEMEDIVMSEYGGGQQTYARFIEFQEQDYWSCQPSYIQNYAHMRWTLLFIPLDYWGAFYYDDYGQTSYDIDHNTDRKDVGSARSTSVSYNNGYSSTPSGTNGYYSYYDATSKEYQYSGTFNNVTIGTIEREPGNQSRNEKNRIRCVRKKD